MSELLNPVTLKALDRHRSNMMWYQNNYYRLKEGYEGQFIIVIDGDDEKYEYFNDINAVLERLRRDDINKQSVVIEYISDNNESMMF